MQAFIQLILPASQMGEPDDDFVNESPQSKSSNLHREVFGPFGLSSFQRSQSPHKKSSTVSLETGDLPPCKRERPLGAQNNLPFEKTKHGYFSTVPSPPRSPTVEQWKEYASMLSPPPCKNQRPPRPKYCSNEPILRPICRFTFPALDCICIECAGVLAKPQITPCLVCCACIPYSVCTKRMYVTKPQPLMCFECKTAFK